MLTNVICPYHLEGIDENLHMLIQSKCHRVPLDDTLEELINPSGILASEYDRIRKEILNEKLLNTEENVL